MSSRKNSPFNIHYLLLTIFLSQFSILHSQITFGNKSFGTCEIVEAQLGNDGLSMSFEASEVNTLTMVIGDDGSTPDFYQLLLNIVLTEPIPFPITASRGNQVSIPLSNIRAGLDEEAFMRSQVQSMGSVSAPQMSMDPAALEAKMKDIAMKMQSGEITMEEGSKQIEALSNQALQEIETMEIPEFEEMESRSTYALALFDTRDQTMSTAFDGTFVIETFTETEFVASFNGMQMVECREKRVVISEEEKTKCRKVRSSILPDSYVLEESPVRVKINARLKSFLDNR